MAMLLACTGSTHFGFHLENRAIPSEVCHDFAHCLPVGSGYLAMSAQCFYVCQTWQYSQIIWCWITCAIDTALLSHTWSTHMKLCNGFGWYFVSFWSVLIHCSTWFIWSRNRNLFSDILLIFQPMYAWYDLLSACFVWNISWCGSKRNKFGLSLEITADLTASYTSVPLWYVYVSKIL
jgi:hypothetical protein